MKDKFETYKLYRTIHNMSFKLTREELIDWIHKTYSIKRIYKGTGICAIKDCSHEKHEEEGEVSEFCLKHIVNQVL